MMSERDFEREKRAFLLIKQGVRDMLEAGYEARMLDDLQMGDFKVMFVGPAEPGQKPDVRVLNIPRQYLEVLLPFGSQEFLRFHALWAEAERVNKAMYAVLSAAITKGLEDLKNGGYDGGKEEYQA